MYTSKHIYIIEVSLWTTATLIDYLPILNGGMSFDGTAFTVPEDGIYYIYGMVTIEHNGVQTCGFSLAVSVDTYLTANDQSVSGAQQSLFGSQVRKLQTGDRVLMTTSNCKYNFGFDQAYFSIYLLERGL